MADTGVTMDQAELDRLWDEFHRCVTMTSRELRDDPGDPGDDAWRRRLMALGHDPLRAGR